VVANNAQVGRPVLTTRLLQIGLVMQMSGEAERVVAYATGVDPIYYLPEAFPGQAFLAMSLALQVLAIVNFIVLATWLFKATGFIQGKTTPPLTISPGWAVGCWFIPIVNFLAPCMVMSEIYNASRTPIVWRSTPPVLVLLWWGATLGGIVVAIASRFSGSLHVHLPPPDTQYAAIYGFGSLRLLMLLVVVTLVTGFQKTVQHAVTRDVEAVF